MNEVFAHELCSYPPILFEIIDVLLTSNKSQLADAIWNQVTDVASPPENVHHVLDGGALLHRISWPRGESYDVICSRYVTYVINKYGSATVVFDGYGNGPSTKDMTHSKRVRSGIGAEVHFTGDMVCAMKKDSFLSNKNNKQRFIALLAVHLERRGKDILHAKADADVLLVQTTVETAERRNTVSVGEDTDLLWEAGSKLWELNLTSTFGQNQSQIHKDNRDVGTLRSFKVLLANASLKTSCSQMPYWDAIQLLECLALANLWPQRNLSQANFSESKLKYSQIQKPQEVK